LGSCKTHLALFKNTISHALLIQPGPAIKLHTFSDADWASDHDDKRSIGVFCVYLCKNLVSWGVNNNRLLLEVVLKLNKKLLQMLLQKFNG
jgi:hypothetical protein